MRLWNILKEVLFYLNVIGMMKNTMIQFKTIPVTLNVFYVVFGKGHSLVTCLYEQIAYHTYYTRTVTIDPYGGPLCFNKFMLLEKVF